MKATITKIENGYAHLSLDESDKATKGINSASFELMSIETIRALGVLSPAVGKTYNFLMIESL